MDVVRLQVKLVTLQNDVTQSIAEKTIDVGSSAEANSAAATLDVGTTNRTSALEYYVTQWGNGLIGDVVTINARDFAQRVEATLNWGNNDADADGA